MKSFFLKLLTPVFLSLMLFSCINLKKVNDYSLSSLKNLKKFEEIQYAFSKSCNTKCKIQQLEKKQLFRQPCDCENYKKADSVTLILYNIIGGYFEGLSKLSDNELTNYKLDALNTALTEGTFGELQIEKKDVDAYSKIAKTLLRAFTDTYRKKKLSSYVQEANDSLQVLIAKLQFTLESNLVKLLDLEKQRYESYYFDLFENSSSSVYEKKAIIEEFAAILSNIESQKKQIYIYGKGLNSIAKGHQELFENRNKLSSKEFKNLLSDYSSQLKDIINEFNKLKSKD